MSQPLLSKCQPPDKTGRIQNITPENANWDYVGFEVYQLTSGQTLSLASQDKELCLVLISGLANIETQEQYFGTIGQRMSPFEKTPPYSVYLPQNDTATIVAQTELELAVCQAPGCNGGLQARLIAPTDVGIEHRGKGRNQRLVHNILPETEPADSLLVVEVYTKEGDTSSYPSHKHDTSSATETYLEETYYHRLNPEQGFCMQRVYTDDRSLDEAMAVYNRDVVKVPRGYHPVAMLAGYDGYYLNVMAGPIRQWKFTWEADHQWINSDQYPQN
ncbi:5-deoxy-glucuronate isomerase [Celerinatantimonas diazotrophica]|uniref:5-deoxyglucuronate isomerase n=1 Tax=Celerinatantimonas diazotrophica TaxID=412034 RepID=A0A4R1JLU4_9GAMM|nr:5-deoxy-glucuronate isomerase [Celerinatantimonas diazotrophica]TCK51977.1 5-deoxyglucuronate isomerase [Celerinatantimonas diazotrophica]CAG9296322.1 5-deoxy-glucuronate isomerase [Celerinatantimonas diazotrophica]